MGVSPDGEGNAMTGPERAHLELPVSGMTCASCATRIERRLNRVEGVAASVNYATARASVNFDADCVTPEDLIGAIEATGYQASLPTQADPGSNVPDGPDEITVLRRRLIGSVILTVPVLVLAMVPPWQFAGWQWLAAVLATPVVLWGGLDFHRAAWVNLRHRAATMDTLI